MVNVFMGNKVVVAILRCLTQQKVGFQKEGAVLTFFIHVTARGVCALSRLKALILDY